MLIFKNIVLLMLMLLMMVVTSTGCNCPTERVSQDMGVITKKRMHFRRYIRHTMTAAHRVHLITTQQQSFCVHRNTFGKYKEDDRYFTAIKQCAIILVYIILIIENDNIWE